MKRIAFIVAGILILMLTCPIGAQVKFGIISGMNFSDMKIKGGRDVSSETVTGIGGIFEVDLPWDLSLVLQPMYLRKDATAEAYYDSPPIQIRMAFFELPVLFKYSFGKTIRPYVIAGPGISFLLLSEMEAEFLGINFKGDTRRVTENPDFVLLFGGGVSVTIRRATLFAEAKYTKGLVDLMNGGIIAMRAGPLRLDGYIYEEEEVKTHGIQLMMGVAFSFWH